MVKHQAAQHQVEVVGGIRERLDHPDVEVDRHTSSPKITSQSDLRR
jgi:hypothetical protein